MTYGVIRNIHSCGDGDGVSYIFIQLKKSSTVAAAVLRGAIA
jgi:hypothetical protein